MKKTIGFLSLLLAVLAVASCKDYDDNANPYADTSAITVDSASVEFPAAPSTGTVVVNARNGITRVSAERPWCHATYDGNTVTVNVDLNDNLESRSSQVTVYSGADSTQLTVQQMGFILQLETGSADNSVVSNDNAGTHTFYMKHNTDIDLASSVDWITPQLVGDSLRLSLTENSTGNPRRGYIYYTAGSVRDSIRVTQFENDKDVVGDYYLYYYTNDWEAYDMNLYKRTDGSYALAFSSGTYNSLGFEIPVTLSSSEPMISIRNLSGIGTFTNGGTTYQALVLVMYTNGSSAYRSRDTDLWADGIFGSEDGDTYYSFDVSPYVSSGYEYYALRLAASTDGTYAGLAGNLETLYYAELIKATDDDDDDSAEAKSLSLAKSASRKALKAKALKNWKAPQLLPEAK